MRLIDADALKYTRVQIFHGLNEDGTPCVGGWNAVVMSCAIKDASTINPADLVPKGRWNGEGDGYADGEIVLDVWYCSECNHCIDDGTDEPDLLPKFCPNCGADMRERAAEGGGPYKKEE